MKGIKAIFGALAVAGLLFSGSAFAQENGNRDADGNIVRGPYETNGFWQNWFIGIGGGAQWNYSIMNSDLVGTLKKPAFLGEIQIGKWITPSFGVRFVDEVGFTGNSVITKTGINTSWPNDGKNKKDGYVHLDAMWNLSNAFSGYKETRFWDIIAYVQGGVIDFTNFQAGQGFFENLSKTSDFQWTMGFGFINDFRLGKRVDLYLDFSFPILPSHVYGITNGHPTDYTFKESFGKFAIKPEAKLGLIFNLGRTNFDRHSSVTPVIIPLPFTEDDYNALKKRVDELEKENAALKEEIEALKNQAPDTVYVGSNNVESPAYAFFEIGSAKLTDREKLHLDFFCDNVVANLDEEKGLLVTGSADSATGSAKRNQQLSEQRAKAVKDYLVKKGVAEDRIEVESLGGIEGAVESRRVIVSVK